MSILTDTVDRETRSRMMSGIRSKNTRPEMFVRRYLHGLGFRYSLHSKILPGHPDLVLSKHRVAIFVHGCFWHRHEGCRFASTPSTRTKFWKKKFDANIARDRRNMDALTSNGWRVIVIWECGIRGNGGIRLGWLCNAIISGADREFHWPPAMLDK